MRVALSRHDQILTEVIEDAGGRIFKHTGDGVLAAFPTVVGAAAAAAAGQQRISAVDWGDLDLRIRMAVDTGEVEARGGDYFGPPLNRCARVMTSGHGGQILLSEPAQQALSAEPGFQLRGLGEQRLRGLGTPTKVFQLVVEGLPADFPPLRTDASSAGATRQFGDSIRGYEIRERLSAGRVSVVYRAFQPSVGRQVAVKVIRAEYANHPSFVRRFEVEARTVAGLEHPHIVSLYDYWRDANGAYLVMPLMAGGGLADKNLGSLSLDRVVGVIGQVGSALSYAHRQGVIHRDIKPSNILLDSDSNAYLSDFGIAVRGVEQATGTQSESAIFRAPEDRSGEAVDQRSDIYSLALVVASLLTGSTRTPPDLGSLAEPLRRLLESALSDDPARRPDTVDSFVGRLKALNGGMVAVAEPLVSRNPYKGLRAFDVADARDFYGRDNEIRRLVEVAGGRRLVAVVGPSGSGKSSLVRAGLIPALARGALAGSDQWLTVTTVPGSHPFDELASALGRVATESMGDIAAELGSDERGLLRVSKRLMRGVEGELVIVVDQFEELYTIVTSDEVRSRFIRNLLEVTSDARSRVRVVLTLRADFYDHPLADELLGPIISEANLALAVPGPSQLRETIERPAEQAGVTFETGLTDLLLADVQGQPGGLPLLQFTLAALVAESVDGRVTIADYEQLGGLGGALTRRAESAYQSLRPGQQDVAREIFMRLVSVSEDADDVRRRVRRVELESVGLEAGDVAHVLTAFGDARLLTFDRDPLTRGPTVEVAHEALLRHWERFRSWLEARRESLILHRRYQVAHGEWRQAGEDPDYLLSGGRLSQFEAWNAEGGTTLTPEEREFLDASLARRSAQAADRRRWRRRVSVALVGAAVVSSMLAGIALWQRGIAQTEARVEVVRRLAASSTVALTEDPERAILLALEAADVSLRAGDPVRPEAIAALHEAVHASPLEMRLDGFVPIGFDPDGGLVTGELRYGHLGEGEFSVMIAPVAVLSPDGKVFVERDLEIDETSDAFRPPGSYVLRDATTGEDIARLVATNAAGEDMFVHSRVAWSPDGAMLAARTDDVPAGEAAVVVWAVNSGEEVWSIPVPGPWVSPLFLDSDTLAILDYYGERAVFYDIASRQETGRIENPGYKPISASYDPARRFLVMGSGANEPIQAWDLDTNALVWSRVVGATSEVKVLPEVGLVALTGPEGAIWLVDIDDGTDRGRLLGHSEPPLHLQPDPTGRRLASASSEETLVWDISPAGPAALGSVALGDYWIYPVVSPDGTEVAVSTWPGNRLQRFRLSTGEPVGSPLTGDDLVLPVRLSPDWRLAGTAIDRVGVVIDLTTGATVLETPACTFPVAFNRSGGAMLDGYWLCPDAVADRLIDGRSGAELLGLDVGGFGRWLGGVFNPPGVFEADRYLALIRLGGGVDIYDTLDGRLLTRLEAASEDWEDTSLTLGFDPGGRFLVVGGARSRVAVIDLAMVAEGRTAADSIVFDQPVDPGGVPMVSLNRNGILATSAFGSLRLWDIHRGEQIIQIPVRITRPVSATFTRGGDHLLYIDESESGHVLRRFLLDPNELIDLARSLVTRDLTPEECGRYRLEC
jgi:serine/threonine protein kinase